jgi:hypothetical protein
MFHERAPRRPEGLRRKERIGMDQDKPRKRDTQLPGSASAKPILAHKNRWPGRRATPCPPQGAIGNFFLAAYARKPLIILDSGKENEIF